MRRGWRQGTASEAATPRSRRAHPGLVGLGVVLLVLVVDVAAGAILSGTGAMRPSERGGLRAQIESSARQAMRAPNIRDEPWAEEMGVELARFQLEDPSYVPYLVSAPHDFQGRHLNVSDGERASYRPAIVPGRPPLDVAFLGGSTVFGIGQRDDHTIPSEFARLAEEAGVPIRVHNLGFPAWVRWQEVQYLERRLAEGHRYDLIVIYDGYNEFLVQRTEYDEHPTHYGAGSLQALAERYYAEHGTTPTYTSGLRDLAQTYRRNSALARVADRLLGTEPNPPWARSVPSGTSERQTSAAVDIYRRAHGMTRDLAAAHDTPLRVFWQPTQPGWSRTVLDQLPADVVDLSSVLDGREDELYISEVHTNEEGARLLAEAIWEDLADDVEPGGVSRAPARR